MTHPMPRAVRLVEVGPRDGLQGEARAIATADKLALIDRLALAGLTTIEATAFVSPRWVPQMADHDAVMRGLRRRPGVAYPVLVPNLRGFEAARAAGAEAVAVFAAASEAFSRANLNASIAQSLERFAPVLAAAAAHGVPVRGYVSCALGCPYQGAVAPEAVAGVARDLLAMGCREIALGDTIGVGTPGRTRAMLEAVARHVPLERIAGHFHDTYGQALANLYASLEVGVSVFDAAVAGLGGCPYAPGASGNVATEDVVYLLDGLGIATGVDLAGLGEAGRFICDRLGTPTRSKAAAALAARALSSRASPSSRRG